MGIEDLENGNTVEIPATRLEAMENAIVHWMTEAKFWKQQYEDVMKLVEKRKKSLLKLRFRAEDFPDKP